MDFCWEFVLSAFVLISIVRNSDRTIYYMKFFYFYGMITTVVTLLIPYFMMKPRNVLNFLACSAGLRHVSNVIGLKWILRGEENLNKDYTCVFVANHQSSLDVQGMMDIWPVIKRMTVIAKRELQYAGSFGFAMYLAGLEFIDRDAGGKAGQSMNNAMSKLKRKNIKLWVFPEGTRRNTGEIHKFKKGAFHAAIHAQVPIVPVVFSSYKNFLNTKKKIFEEGEIIITALPEIPTAGLNSDDIDDLIERTRSAMIKEFYATSAEVEITIKK